MREVKRATYTLAPVADDVVALHKKFSTLSKNLETSCTMSSNAVRALKPKAIIAARRPPAATQGAAVIDKVAGPLPSRNPPGGDRALPAAVEADGGP